MSGGAIRRLTVEKIRKVSKLLPPLELQIQYSDVAKNVVLFQAKQLIVATELDNLFNSLMQRAFKGELVS